jgi:hypothetical protein
LGRDRDAARRFLELERRFPTSDWAARAKRARADLALRAHDLLEARSLLLELSRSPDPMARLSAEDGLVAVHSALRRLLATGFALALLMLLAGMTLRAAWPLGPLSLPVELWYYLPVAGLFVLAAATENRAIGMAVAMVAVGGGVILYLSSTLEARRPASSLRVRLRRSAGIALAVLALVFLAVQATGLTPVVMETLRSGPER